MSTIFLDDFKLIELVRQNPHMYDKSDPDYRDLLKKEITWRAIAAALGSTVDNCRRRFRCLRDRFVKERKSRKEELLNGTTKRLIYRKMMFLWDHLSHRNTFRLPEYSMSPSNSEINIQIQDVCHVDLEEMSQTEVPNSLEASADYKSAIAAENLKVIEEMNSSETDAQRSSEIAARISEAAAQQSSEAATLISSEFAEQSLGAAAQTSSKVAEQRSPEIAGQKSSKSHIVTEGVRLSDTDKRKKRKTNSESERSPKKSKQSEVSPAKEPSNVRTSKPVSGPSCNAAFCTVVKDYLDKIVNPMKLSSARIKILTTVHNEIYSTD